MIRSLDKFYLKKIKRRFGEVPYLQCIYTNGLETKIIAYQYGEDIKSIIYENETRD
jgi:hypothetical protein